MPDSTFLDAKSRHIIKTQLSKRAFICWKCRSDNSTRSYEVCPICGWSNCSKCWACSPNCFGTFCDTLEEYEQALKEHEAASLKPGFSEHAWFAEKLVLANKLNPHRAEEREAFLMAEAARYQAEQKELERQRLIARAEFEKRERESLRISMLERENHICKMHELVPIGTVISFPCRPEDIGTVVRYSFSQDGKSEYIHVSVNEAEKRFVFPDAFNNNYLSLI